MFGYFVVETNLYEVKNAEFFAADQNSIFQCYRGEEEMDFISIYY